MRTYTFLHLHVRQVLFRRVQRPVRSILANVHCTGHRENWDYRGEDRVRKRPVIHSKEWGLICPDSWGSVIFIVKAIFWDNMGRTAEELVSSTTGAKHVLFILEKWPVLYIMWRSPCWPQGDAALDLQPVCGWQTRLQEAERCSLYFAISPILFCCHFPHFHHTWQIRGWTMAASVPALPVSLSSPNTIYWKLIYMWRSGAIFQESGFSFHCVDAGDQTQVVRLGGKQIYQMSHLNAVRPPWPFRC